MLSEDTIDAFISKYVKKDQVLAVGTNQLGELLLKKIGLLCEKEKWEITIIPTSTSQVQTAQTFHLPLTTLNEREVDLAIEFVGQADHDYSFIKRYSLSLIRDKMIAQSAAELIAILPENEYVEKLHGKVPFEISAFGWKRTLLLLEQIGRVGHAQYTQEPEKTESGHYLVEVEIDEGLTPEEIDTQARLIPGVLETGLFLGMADRLLLAGEEKITVKSRLEFDE
ncbi:MAG: ribose-5-phosphate isomerase A [Candidatus Diapherotrites archaeon]